jgi:hypothetical protein
MRLKFDLIFVNPFAYLNELRIAGEHIILFHSVLINTLHEANYCVVYQ